MQMRREAVRNPSWVKMNVLIPGLRRYIHLSDLFDRFPDRQICAFEDRSIEEPCKVEAERLATSPLSEVDSERYNLNLVGKEVAGIKHALWLLEHRPEVLLQFLRGGNSLEFPGTKVICREGRKLHNPRLKLVKGTEWFIPVMPRMDNLSHLRIIWTPMGAGDMESSTRFARAYPM